MIAGSRPNSRSTLVGFGPRTTIEVLPSAATIAAASMARLNHLHQRANAHTGQENCHLESAGDQMLRKVERSVIIFQRNFAHRGRDDRDAPEPLRSFRPSRRPSGFRTQ